MGAEAPAEHIIAIIVAVTGSYILPLTVPFVHRFSSRVLVRGIMLAALTTVAMMTLFSFRSPFDTMHQKRLFVLHMENVSLKYRIMSVALHDGC